MILSLRIRGYERDPGFAGDGAAAGSGGASTSKRATVKFVNETFGCRTSSCEQPSIDTLEGTFTGRVRTCSYLLVEDSEFSNSSHIELSSHTRGLRLTMSPCMNLGLADKTRLQRRRSGYHSGASGVCCWFAGACSGSNHLPLLCHLRCRY